MDTASTLTQDKYKREFQLQTKQRSDSLMNYFLAAYFLLGLFLATYYDTWLIGIGVGSLSLIAYYSSKLLLPNSTQYQYVLSIVYGIFMAQFIYQMHGMFEMHFFAFIGSAILITYQNWKLQIPLALVVVVHHATFGYLQYIGIEGVYFTQLDYMTLETFIYHGILATVVFGLCGLWAFNFKRFNDSHVTQSFEIGQLQEADKRKAELEKINKELERRVEERTEDITITNKALRSEIEERIELTRQLEGKNKDITDSILYAERLQNAIIPDVRILQQNFKKFFLFNRQKNIVGGDFFWFNKSGDNTMIACGDCTGHGVPGAFMTIIGIDVLNKMITNPQWKTPAQAIEIVDAELNTTLGGDKSGRMDDGMDMALCMINTKEKKIQFSGAISSIAIVSGDEVKVYKGSRFGLGAYMELNEKRFANQEISYAEGDALYMFTDGYPDQFGGAENKKFTLPRLTNLFSQIHKLPAEEQRESLKRALDEWKGDNAQTDDVMVLGLEL